MADRTKDLTNGKPAKMILGFALPLMFGNLFQQMYTLVDTAVVGNVVGVDALAALGAADWLNFCVVGLITGFTEGFSILISHKFGSRDEKGLKDAVAAIMVIGTVIALLAMLISQIFLNRILGALNTPAEIMEMSVMYLRIMFCGPVIVMAYNASAAILRAMGDSRTPLYAMIAAALINVGLDLLFVAVFHWGIRGAAAATLIAQGFSFLVCFHSLRRLPVLSVKKENFRWNPGIVKKLFLLGLPTAFQNVVIGGGGMIVQSVINRYDVVYVAGFTATNKLYGLLEVAATSYGFATASFIGQNRGAEKFGRIRKGMKASVIMAVITSFAISVFMLLCGRFLVGLFVPPDAADAAAVTEIAFRYLKVMAAFLVILYLLHVHRSGLMGLGDSIVPMISGIAELIMRVVTIMLLPQIIGERGLFFAEVTAWAGAAAILIITFYFRLFRLPNKSCNSV